MWRFDQKRLDLADICKLEPKTAAIEIQRIYEQVAPGISTLLEAAKAMAKVEEEVLRISAEMWGREHGKIQGGTEETALRREITDLLTYVREAQPKVAALVDYVKGMDADYFKRLE